MNASSTQGGYKHETLFVTPRTCLLQICRPHEMNHIMVANRLDAVKPRFLLKKISSLLDIQQL